MRIVPYALILLSVVIVGIFLHHNDSDNNIDTVALAKPQKKSPKQHISHKTLPKNTNAGTSTKTNRLGQVYKVDLTKTYTDERGILRFEGGARVPNPDDFKRATPVTQRRNIPRFNHRSESEIATIITTDPGSMLFGTPMYGENFDQDFLQSLLTPTEITEEDSERDKEIKELVSEIKKEMVERIKEGETPSSILRREREELRRLAQYKSHLLTEIRTIVSDKEYSDTDIDDFLLAANKMLESKGIAPIQNNAFIRNRQRYLNLAARREAESTAKEEK